MESATKVSAELFTMGAKTKRGGLWGNKTVVDIIRNPFYKGTYRYNYRESARGKKKPEAEWIIIDNNHEKIVSVDLWEKCNHIMDLNAQRNSANHRRKINIHAFSSLLICNHCGESFLAGLDRPRLDGYTPSRYRCRNRAHNHGCKAPLVGDVTIGPFIFNYVANMLNAYKSFNPLSTSKELEKILLTGDPFKDISHISSGLNELHNLFIADNRKVSFLL